MTNKVQKELISNLVKTHPNPAQAFIEAIKNVPEHTEEILRIAGGLKVDLTNK